MPGTELFGAEERKEIEDVLSTGILFRFNHDAQRNNFWKAKDFEAEVINITHAKYALAVFGLSLSSILAIPPFPFSPVKFSGLMDLVFASDNLYRLPILRSRVFFSRCENAFCPIRQAISIENNKIVLIKNSFNRLKKLIKYFYPHDSLFTN